MSNCRIIVKTKLFMDKIDLQPNDLLVKPIEDYFPKFTETKNFLVGRIVNVGKDVKKEHLGCLVYYRNITEPIDLIDIGKFDLISKSACLIVRLDDKEEV